MKSEQRDMCEILHVFECLENRRWSPKVQRVLMLHPSKMHDGLTLMETAIRCHDGSEESP